MKLRNKKTGVIKEIFMPEATTLKEFCKLYEDYEEPKEYWYIDYGGRIKSINDSGDEEDIARKSIGNYFETNEEAEKAVEKLKAWKRLKDKGFKFKRISDYDGTAIIIRGDSVSTDVIKVFDDIDLIFGGGE